MTPPRRGLSPEAFARDLFPSTTGRLTPTTEAYRLFVVDLIRQQDVPDVPRAILRLVRDAKQFDSARRRPRARRDTERGPTEFASSLVGALAAYWHACETQYAPPLRKAAARRRLAKRIEALAQEIETANADAYGSPVRNLRDVVKNARRARRRWPQIIADLKADAAAFDNLPLLLENYANCLRTPFGMDDRQFKHRSLERDAEMRVLGLIESRTGSLHYDQVSTLFNAVRSLAGRGDADREVNAKVLEKRRSDYRKARKTPAEVGDGTLWLVLHYVMTRGSFR